MTKSSFLIVCVVVLFTETTWGTWSLCTVTCGGGWRKRVGKCVGTKCHKWKKDIERCNPDPCPTPSPPPPTTTTTPTPTTTPEPGTYIMYQNVMHQLHTMVCDEVHLLSIWYVNHSARSTHNSLRVIDFSISFPGLVFLLPWQLLNSSLDKNEIWFKSCPMNVYVKV